MKFNKSTIYISLFGLLYLIVAFSSFFHAVSFFGLANNSWMSVILAFAFEVGQAAVLFSLLTSKKDRARIMPWVLMTMFTLVQVIGNVFSCYKYIVNNSTEDLKYFKEPIFIWTDIPDDQATVIIVYVVGALLPICSLLLTSMITNYLSDIGELDDEKKKEDDNLEEKIEETEEHKEEKSNESNNELKEILSKGINKLKKEINKKSSKSNKQKVTETESEETVDDKKEQVIDEKTDDNLTEEQENKKESYFINL